MVKIKKTLKNAGADNLTPSIPQYFSWINNTNEGSTEEQTLVNLEFFAYMQKTYGMQIKIYAWDAGNFDGASGGYGNVNSKKFMSQYPNGYKNVVEKAAQLGIRLGLWGSPDGFGDTPDSEKERFDFFVHLCRDYGFAEFKLDGVCGSLRPKKADIFGKMLKECRRYSPNLIVLNHRLDFYSAEKYITTFLWNGNETYVDVLCNNDCTGMHNRTFMFHRGHVKNMQRLAEDHGVCISSAIDYFEDELIYQAFNRSLILAPEMYGNPWFMRDDELPKLARVYNLSKNNADLLINGASLPPSYGCCAATRGNDKKRFISTGNDTWQTKKIELHIDESIGITKKDSSYTVNIRHPFECCMGTFNYGDTLEVELMPFRATLIEIAAPECLSPIICGGIYEVLREDENGVPISIKLLQKDSELKLLYGKTLTPYSGKTVDGVKENAPVYITSLKDETPFPSNGEKLYETAMFAINNDSLESRSIKRSGDTFIPEVKAAREAFFNQKTYVLRGCEAKNMFDGNPQTFFDAQTKCYCGHDQRILGGCLRIDFGDIFDADSVEIDFFSTQTPTTEIPSQTVPLLGEYACSLDSWKPTGTAELLTVQKEKSIDVVKFRVHTVYTAKGSIMRAVYPINNKLKYLRLECPMDRIYAVRLIKNKKEIKLKNPKANNMQAHYRHRTVELSKSGSFILPNYREGAFIAVAFEGEHGDELAYCCAEIDGNMYGFERRAPEYKANMWEHSVVKTEKYYTYFMQLAPNLAGKEIKIYALFCDNDRCNMDCNVYLCDKH